MITTHYMDEAERCHRLAYIAGGRLMAEGTVAEVIEGAALVTYEVAGANQPEVAAKLRASDAITQAVAFGNSLHVSGTDAQAIQRALSESLGPDQRWKEIPSELEDVFIDLMRRAQEQRKS